MKLSLSTIPDAGLVLDVAEPLVSTHFKLCSPVRASLRIDKAEAEIFVRGKAGIALELLCSRCIKTFAKDMDLDINAVYAPIAEFRKEDNHEVYDDELDMAFYEGDDLDLDELLKEQIILNIPMQPLCNEDCKGICPGCGTDLNVASCRCEHEHTDSRLEILKTLLHNGKE